MTRLLIIAQDVAPDAWRNPPAPNDAPRSQPGRGLEQEDCNEISIV